MTKPQPSPESKPGLLVVDDDPLITDTLAFALGTEYTVYACDRARTPIELLRQLDAPPPLALVDLGLPPAPHLPDEGFRLIADLLAHSPRMRIFVLSGQNEAPTRAMRARSAPGSSSPSRPIRRACARALARGLGAAGEPRTQRLRRREPAARQAARARSRNSPPRLIRC